MKNKLFKGLMVASLALIAILTISLTTVSAKSVYDEYALETYSEALEVDETFSLEDMLIYAIQDEYMAKAEYEAIIETFGEVNPFVRILQAEQTHIDLLLPLFETYGIEVPENQALDYVVIPESITSALATGVEAEEANIAMYELFLSQDNLPDDVRAAFESLKSASENHLQAFSRDRYAYVGEDMMNQFKKMWRKGFQGSNGQSGQNDSSRQAKSQSGECVIN